MFPLSPALIKLVFGAVLVAALVGWAGVEHIGKLKAQKDVATAQKDVATLQGEVKLKDAKIAEQNRGIDTLLKAVLTAKAKAAMAEERRKEINAGLDQQVKALQVALDKATPQAAGCHEALEEWRNDK